MFQAIIFVLREVNNDYAGELILDHDLGISVVNTALAVARCLSITDTKKPMSVSLIGFLYITMYQ